MTKEYVAGEPDRVDGWRDAKGVVHATRDQALAKNFQYDLEDACKQLELYRRVGGLSVIGVIRKFANENPDMLRILVGDRDFT